MSVKQVLSENFFLPQIPILLQGGKCQFYLFSGQMRPYWSNLSKNVPGIFGSRDDHTTNKYHKYAIYSAPYKVKMLQVRL